MPDAILWRLDWSDQGVFGRFVAGGLGLLSGELPWRGNAASVSCVALGAYRAVATYSPRFGCALYLLGPTDPRTGIRLHPANLMGDRTKGYLSQLNGCVALGERLGYMDGQKALLLSRPAMRRLYAYFGGRPFFLEIRDGRGGG